MNQLASLVWNKLIHHIYSFYYYVDIIAYHGLHFYNPKRREFINFYVAKPWIHVWMPGIMCTVFGIIGLYAVAIDREDQVYRKLMLVEFLPFQGRRNLLLSLLVWTWFQVGNMFFVVSHNLYDYLYLALLLVNKNGSVRPLDLELDEMSYQKFAAFRRFILVMLNMSIANITIIAMTAVTFQIVHKSLMERDAFYTCVWIAAVIPWIVYICAVGYGIPSLALITAYYICLRQRSLTKLMDSFNWRVHSHSSHFTRMMVTRRFITLNRRYARLYREIDQYSHSFRKSLSIFLMEYVLLIAVITHLIFLTKLTLPYRCLYSFIYLVLTTMLSVVILFLNRVSKSNQLMGKRVYSFSCHSFSSTCNKLTDLIKFETVSQSLCNVRTGFKTSNDDVIDSKTHLMVIYLISSLFFLIFKQTKN